MATAKSCEDNERSSIGPTIGYLVELEVVLFGSVARKFRVIVELIHSRIIAEGFIELKSQVHCGSVGMPREKNTPSNHSSTTRFPEQTDLLALLFRDTPLLNTDVVTVTELLVTRACT